MPIFGAHACRASAFKRGALAAGALTLAACGGGDQADNASPAATPDKTILAVSSAAAVRDAERFVVVFRATVGDAAREAAEAVRGHPGQVVHIYSRAIKGFAVTLPHAAADAFLQAMERRPNVDHVEVDIPMAASQTVESNPPWGLDRSDQRDLPLNGSYTYTATGTGVTAYVVDTGILAGHVDFGGRVAGGYTAIADGKGTSDCNGHGTHVAGTVGGSTWGIAKGVALVPVRVLDCSGSGSLSGVIAGLDWVLANAVRPALVNMSLGGGASSSLDAAVANTVAGGIPVVVAAGNSNANACDYSPAREPTAITIGATTSSDARASYSNFGTCLDLFAPGSAIKSAWYITTAATNTISGTSMASPHVAGLAALLLQAAPAATPLQVDQAIKTAATGAKVSSPGAGSPNLLIYTDAAVGSEPPPGVISRVSVASLAGSSASARKGWLATVGIAVKDASGAPVPGAVVSGSFTVGGLALSCTAAADGACSVTSGNISKGTTQTTFTVKGITGTAMAYEPAANTVTSIVVRKPG